MYRLQGRHVKEIYNPSSLVPVPARCGEMNIGKKELATFQDKRYSGQNNDIVVKSLQIRNAAFYQSRHSRGLLGGNPVVSMRYGSPSPTKDLEDDALLRG